MQYPRPHTSANDAPGRTRAPSGAASIIPARFAASCRGGHHSGAGSHDRGCCAALRFAELYESLVAAKTPDEFRDRGRSLL